ncbi:MAG: hypothetical protein LBK29_02105 [Oscillospiraceae bacterium]|jgi:hypothetical protein|nr:hypothetical protein [Oscillospiraceae bacterium]
MQKTARKEKELEEENDSADDFIQKKDKSWIKRSADLSEDSEKIKKDFFKKKKKLREFLPECHKERNNVPDRLGFFDTKFGSVAIGFDKFKKNSQIFFTLMPESDSNSKTNSAKKDFGNEHNYFGKYFKGEGKKFKSNSIGFKYNPRDKSLRKMEDVASDGKIESENEMLYGEEEEEAEIDELENQKEILPSKEKSEAYLAVDNLKEIEKEKQRDNYAIKNEIESFIKKLQDNKLKMFEASEDVKTYFKRIAGVQNGNDILYAIKKRLEEMVKSGKAKNIKDALEKINISESDKKYILNLFSKL